MKKAREERQVAYYDRQEPEKRVKSLETIIHVEATIKNCSIVPSFSPESCTSLKTIHHCLETIIHVEAAIKNCGLQDQTNAIISQIFGNEESPGLLEAECEKRARCGISRAHLSVKHTYQGGGENIQVSYKSVNNDEGVHDCRC